MQGGADWALAAKDRKALGAAEIPRAARQQDSSVAGRARAALALTAQPRQLPCRDSERLQVARFLEEALGQGGEPCRPSCVVSTTTQPFHGQSCTGCMPSNVCD